MADRIVVMNGGHVQQVGRPEYLYANPANLFVAGFIGSPAMNLLSLPALTATFSLANNAIRCRRATGSDPRLAGRSPGTYYRPRGGGPSAPAGHRSATRTDGADYLLHVSTPIGTLRAAATAARCRRKASRYRSASRLPMCIFSC